MCETCTLAVFTLMTSSAAISRLVKPRATSARTSALAPRQAEVRERVGGLGTRGRAAARGSRRARAASSSSSRSSGARAEPRGDGVRFARSGAPASVRDAPAATSASAWRQAAVGREWRALEPFPCIGGVGPPVRPRRAARRGRARPRRARASQPAFGVIGRGRRWRRAGRRPGARSRLVELDRGAASASRRAPCERGQLGLCAQSLGAQLDADLRLGPGGPGAHARPSSNGRGRRPSSGAPRGRARRRTRRTSRAGRGSSAHAWRGRRRGAHGRRRSSTAADLELGADDQQPCAGSSAVIRAQRDRAEHGRPSSHSPIASSASIRFATRTVLVRDSVASAYASSPTCGESAPPPVAGRASSARR